MIKYAFIAAVVRDAMAVAIAVPVAKENLNYCT